MVLHEFRSRERSYVVRRAEQRDVDAVVHLLEDDGIVVARDGGGAWDAATAFLRIDADADQLLVVVDDAGGAAAATLQLTFTPGLSRRGAVRMQIEAVRVRSDLRGSGVGSALVRWALDHGRDRGAVLAQLTSDAARSDAHTFYARLGFTPSHVGFKRPLTV